MTVCQYRRTILIDLVYHFAANNKRKIMLYKKLSYLNFTLSYIFNFLMLVLLLLNLNVICSYVLIQ